VTWSRRAWLWGPVLAAMTAIFIASAQPDLRPPDGITNEQAHSTGYAGLSVLVARALAGGFGVRLSWWRAAGAVAIATAYGCSDEWHQSFVPGREADLYDIWVDAVGAVAGAAGCWAWGIIRSRSDV
jgi:VanZ family protein